MSIPGIPAGTHRQVLQAFLRELQSSRAFGNGRGVKTWIVWNGRATVVPPSVDVMPACQLTLLSGPVRRLATGRRVGGPMLYTVVSEPTLQVDLWTRGTDQGDLADLADALTGALGPQAEADRTGLEVRLAAAGVRDWELVRDILPADDSPAFLSQEFTRGRGAYRLKIQLYS
jgi:hypothetical protein